MMRVPPPEPALISVALDFEVVDQLKEMPQSLLKLEIDLFSLPTGIGEKGVRPSRPYLLMMADGQSGMIIASEMMTIEDSLTEMHGRVPMLLATRLAEAGVMPAEISVRPGLLAGLLNPLANLLNIRLREAGQLPGIDAAMDSMFSWMMIGGEL